MKCKVVFCKHWKDFSCSLPEEKQEIDLQGKCVKMRDAEHLDTAMMKERMERLKQVL